MSRSHILPGLYKGPEVPHSMKEKCPCPKHSRDHWSGGLPRLAAVALATLLGGWPADAQPVSRRRFSASSVSHCDEKPGALPRCPFCYAPHFMVLYIDGCYTRRVLLRQNQCVQTTTSVPLAQKARPQLASWARASDCLPLGSPHGLTGTAGLVPGSPPCLWCCHLSWVCLCPSACWKCPPLTHLSPGFHERPLGF